MNIDAIIISDIGEDSVSGTSPLRLKIDGRTADIQVVLNYLQHQGRTVLPIKDDRVMSWSSAPKLNGIYLFSYLTQHGFDVELIDSYYEEREKFYSLLQHSPRVIVISTTFIHNKKNLYKLVNDIRSLAPDIFIVVGGPFVFLSFQTLQRFISQRYISEMAKDDFLFIDNDDRPFVDLYIISLRGEQILCDALGRVKNNQPTDNLPNTALSVGNKYEFNNQVDDISNAEKISIDWRTLPDNIFKSGVVPMQASNGCPYRCAFCNFVKDRRLMFVKPIDQLVTELKAVSDRGARYVWFVDDNFRLGSRDLKSVCQRFVDENIQIRWMSFIRASALKDVDGELLRQAGCIEVQLGLESADPQVLRNMNKKADSVLYSEVIKKLLVSGINCSCYFIFGFPGETVETVTRTRKFIKEIEHPELDGVVSFSIFPFILPPLSPIYELEMREKYGLTGHMFNWEHLTMNYKQATEQVIKTFLELENSSVIYRGDNLDILYAMNPQLRRQFVAKRHKLAKLAMNRPIEKCDIIDEFNNFFRLELNHAK